MRAHVLLSVAALCAGGRQTSDRCLHTTSFARHTTARPPRDPPHQTSVRRKHTSCFLWLLYAPVGGGPPARSPHASLTARNDRSRGPPWPCRRPPAPPQARTTGSQRDKTLPAQHISRSNGTKFSLLVVKRSFWPVLRMQGEFYPGYDIHGPQQGEFYPGILVAHGPHPGSAMIIHVLLAQQRP